MTVEKHLFTHSFLLAFCFVAFILLPFHLWLYVGHFYNKSQGKTIHYNVIF
jgi:hypothetical protein